MEFRKDINGLRAVAVVSVVIFHFFGDALSGGFVGVDVFFVISGYLMTAIIYSRLTQHSFSILDFYLARAKRIFPALAALCLTLFLFGNLFLNIIDLQTLNKHISSSLLFFSNMVYLTESGYFNADSHSKWLLHTWSLSVEWQFYLLYPIAAIAVCRLFGVNWLKLSLVVATPLVFLLSLLMTRLMPLESYFLFPTRAWEMMLGGLAYLYPLDKRLSLRARHLMEYVGLALIVLSCVVFSSQMIWPDSWTLFPVVGTYLVILSHNSRSHWLNNRISQSLGNWSYSIYLWHWPIVVLAHYLESQWLIYIGIPVSIMLGYLSFEFIERPQWRFMHQRRRVAALVILIILMPSYQYWHADKQLYSNVQRYEDLLIGHYYQNELGQVSYNDSFDVVAINPTNPLQMLMVGDSHSAHYSYGISQSNSVGVTHRWVGACMAFRDMVSAANQPWKDSNWQSECYSLYRFVEHNKQMPVILAQQWGEQKLICERNCDQIDLDKGYYEHLADELEKLLHVIGDRPVFVIGQVPVPKRSMLKCMKKPDNSSCERQTTNISSNRKHTNEQLKAIAKSYPNLNFINPFDAVCDSSGVCTTIFDDKNIFFDDGHLSAFGSKLIWQYIEEKIVETLQPISDPTWQ